MKEAALPKNQNRGRDSGQRLLWAVTTVIALAILVSFFAIAGRNDNNAQYQAPPSSTTTGSGTRP